MRTAIIENGKVVNVILGQIDGSIEIPNEFGIGDLYENGEFKKAPIVEPEIVIEIPQTITKLQAMKQMKVIGKWEAFKTIIANDEDINDEWVLSDNLNRSYPLVLSVAQLFEFSESDIDNFFIEASKL